MVRYVLINFRKCRAKYRANVRFTDSFKNHFISSFIYVIVADDRISDIDGIEYLIETLLSNAQ